MFQSVISNQIENDVDHQVNMEFLFNPYQVGRDNEYSGGPPYRRLAPHVIAMARNGPLLHLLDRRHSWAAVYEVESAF